jgi:hypothetical protein
LSRTAFKIAATLTPASFALSALATAPTVNRALYAGTDTSAEADVEILGGSSVCPSTRTAPLADIAITRSNFLICTFY